MYNILRRNEIAEQIKPANDITEQIERVTGGHIEWLTYLPLDGWMNGQKETDKHIESEG